VIDDVLHLLRCPHCGEALTASDATVRCPSRHSFDVARQGYLNLLPGDAATGTADTPAMVAAREAFLAGGHFDHLGDRVAEEARAAVGEAGEGAVVELGAGTGWYLARVLQRLPHCSGLALDLSKHALRRAARAHPRIGAVACDAWRPLPVRDGVAALALSVFAPRGAAELARVLRPGAAALVVSPAVEHLAELVSALGLLGIEPGKRERLEERLGPHFDLERRGELSWQLRLDRAAARNAALMGPSAVHLETAELEARLAALPEVSTVTAAVEIAVFRAV
jgi:23S rRNA (guanine745-N1)-methyltransferase